jgi:hypothetical protein
MRGSGREPRGFGNSREALVKVRAFGCSRSPTSASRLLLSNLIVFPFAVPIHRKEIFGPKTGSKTVIIDNITYLREGTEKANDALPLMKQLKLLKQRHDLSILTLAHTPKRNLSNPLTRNDLQGSKMLMNLCDSSFAIGESHTDIRLRYLKQIKQRNCEQVYNADNIIICEVDKLDNFLQFKFIDYGREFEHLKPRSEDDKVKKQQEAAELKVQGFSNCEIARRIGVSEKTIRNWLK